MHILISARAKFGQLYQCTPLIVGDKYTDCEIMSFLGAKLTRDFPEPSGPPVYVLSATPAAVMDALQERGFELKLSYTVEGYITWMMSKPLEKFEETSSSEMHFPRDVSPIEPRNRDDATCARHDTLPKSNHPGPCATSSQNTTFRKTTSVHQTKSKEKETQNMSTQTVDTQSERSQSDEHPGKTERTERHHEKSDRHNERIQPTKSRSETSHPEKTKSDASQTEPQAKKPQGKVDPKSKPKTEKQSRPSVDSGKPTTATSSDNETQPVITSSESSLAVRKTERTEKKEESPSKKKKKQSTVSAVSREEEAARKKEKKSVKP